MSTTTATLLVKIKTEGEAQLAAVSNTIKKSLGDTVTSVKQVSDTTDKSSGSFRLFGINVVDVAAKLYLFQVGARNLIGAIEGLFKLGELGAKVTQTGESFNFLMQRMGISLDIMDKLREASGGLATDYETQLRVQRLVAGQTEEVGRAMALASPTLIEMARAAVKLDPSIKSVDFAMESLSTGIKRQSVRWVDNLNIIVRSGVANEAYAKTIGKNVADLNEEEKQLAYLNAVLEGHDRLLAQVGGNVESLTDDYGKLRVNVEEGRESIAQFTDQAIRPLIRSLNEASDSFDTFLKTGKEPSTVSNFWFDPKWWKFLGATWEEVAPKLLKFNYILGDAITPSTHYVKTLERAGIILRDFSDETDRLANATSSLAEELNSGSYAVDEYASKWNDAIDTFGEKYIKGQQKLLEGTADISQKLIDETQDSQARITQIHSDASDQRLKIEKNFNEQTSDLNESYLEKRKVLEDQLSALVNRRLGIAPALTKAGEELKRLQDMASKAIREGIDPAKLFPNPSDPNSGYYDPNRLLNLLEAISRQEIRVQEETIQKQLDLLTEDILLF